MGVMNDDRFETQLREAAREYHRPPETPREAMWAAIDAERLRRRAARRLPRLGPASRWSLGLAAVLVLGIAIGRWIRPGAGNGTVTPPIPVAGRSSEGVAYELAAAQYLSRTESLLAGFRADARTGGRPDAQFLGQARELLSSTRLLLDSPAGRDPQLKPLLEDLEVVLAQIALLPASHDSADVQLINQGIDQGSVLTRLRAAIPAGTTPAHPQGAI
jgi:hypothetical protein